MALALFPALPGIEYPVKRTPLMSTLRQKAISGRETFQPLWTAPLYRYELSFSVLRAAQAYAEWQLLAGFWASVMATPGGVFKFNDPNDMSVTAQAFAIGDGSTNSFQLVRSLGGFDEPVLDPQTCQIYENGTSTGAWSFANGSADESGGVVTFATAPASGVALTWTGTFDWLCRFDQDSLEYDNFMYQLWALKKCSFVTVRL